MLGLSLGKLIFLAVVIAVVWYGFRYAGRVEAIRRSAREEIARRRSDSRPSAARVEDLVKCSRCGTFVAASGAAKCGKPDCPLG